MSRTLDESIRAKVEWKLVDGLFNQFSALLIGGVAPASSAGLAYFRTRDRVYLGWAILLIVVLVGRVGTNIAFHRRKDRHGRIHMWKRRALVGAWINAGLVGLAGAYAVIGNDEFNKLMMVSQLTAYVMGAAARNSLYPRAAAGSILLPQGALIVGFLATGDLYFMILTLFIVLFTVAALSIMNHQYAQTVAALVATEEKAILVTKVEDELVLVKRMEAQLDYAAHHDKLTGLANRALFMARLDLAVQRVNSAAQPMFAVMFLDFDRFKLTNDTLGHDAGDELLRQIAGRLQREYPAADIGANPSTANVVSRFGGDEFLVLINDLEAPDTAVRAAERVLAALAVPYSIGAAEVQSTASIGIVTSDQCHGAPEVVLRNADLAMFEAKNAGRGRAIVFDESMHTRVARRATLEQDLRLAIGSSQLYLLYQPIVDLGSGRIVSAEALLRWEHPSLGAISPAEFIPIAEDSGLIVAVGVWVQREACETLVGWSRQDPEFAPDTISVNVSRAELGLGGGLIQQIRDLLHAAGLPASRLQLEVTEREVMRDPAGARMILCDLQRLGVRLAMDDFGTGASSLSLIRDFPFDCIKIDRSFVEGLGTRPDVLAVIHATINLVENLGMASVAEGVEEHAQVAVLQSIGCHLAQGYLIGRPVSAAALLLAARQQAGASNGFKTHYPS